MQLQQQQFKKYQQKLPQQQPKQQQQHKQMEHSQQQQQRKHQLEQQVHHDVPTTSVRKFRYRFFQQKHKNPKKRIQTIPGIDLCKCHFTSSQTFFL